MGKGKREIAKENGGTFWARRNHLRVDVEAEGGNLINPGGAKKWQRKENVPGGGKGGGELAKPMRRQKH
jgi:hypothetical protein